MEIPTFQDITRRSIKRVFLDTRTFGETRTIRFAGKEYTDIPVVLSGPIAKKRARSADDYVQGLHQISAVLYCASEDLGGKLPVPESTLEILPVEGEKRTQTYGVVSAVSHMGMVHIELEAMA